ncbi:MAG TPA: TonB family protein [Smithellaceae bacterium]|jgi:protein TonB|nr:TonB family protein [Smithellaceae bacterium]
MAMTTEKQNRFLSVCASVGLHALAAAVLMFGLTGPATVPKAPGSLDFVWASIAAGKDDSLSPVPKALQKKPPAGEGRSLAAEEAQTPQNAPAEIRTAVPAGENTAAGDAPAPFGSPTAVYAEASGHGILSDAGRAQAVPAMQPVLSSAYPRYRENPAPGYPETARQRGYEGVVLVAVEILADGRVGKAVVRQSSGYAILDHTAVSAVRDWKFVPAKRSGVPYKTWAELPIKFVIHENSHS